MKEHLKRGIAVHHSGILPIVKEVCNINHMCTLLHVHCIMETKERLHNVACLQQHSHI